MGYSICKEGKTGWRILWEHWENGKKTKRHVKRSEWPNLGFALCSSIEQAREIAEHLNSKVRIVEDEKRRNRLEIRRKQDNLKRCAYLPSMYVREFEKSVVSAKSLRVDHWEAAKRAIRAVNLAPEDWYFLSHQFYNYFSEKGYSPDYSNRIRRLLNEWGRFLCRKTKSFWESIPAPRGKFANKIREKYEVKTNGGRFRARLSLDLLRSKRHELDREAYNWLFISVAFGLRPEEINKSLRISGKWGLRENALYVYQYKLERTEPNPKRRWKKIDILLPQQEEAKKLIMSQAFKAPSRKTLHKVFGEKMTYYGGRKEFFPAMKKQFDAYRVSSWMGHKSLETARRSYDDPEDDFLPSAMELTGSR